MNNVYNSLVASAYRTVNIKCLVLC